MSQPQDPKILAALTSSLALESTLERLLEALKAQMPVDGIFANIFLTDPNRVAFLAQADRDGAQRLSTEIGVPAEIVALKRGGASPILRMGDIENDPFTLFVAPQVVPAIRSFLMVRCQVEGRHMGIVCFWSRARNAFTLAHEALLAPYVNALSLNVGFAVVSRLRTQVEKKTREAQALKAQLDEQRYGPLNELLARTPSLRHLAETIRSLARYDATVLITGESGTGKEVIATVIQQTGARAQKPFVKVNCSAIAPTLIESELFGFEKGAFTGATARHAGLFEQADGGTLFLDEVSELSADMQVKLLRVLQQQTFRRVGGTQEIAVNVRIIAATNKPLRELVAAGKFRLDLLYRLAVIPLHVPPLSERLEDLLPLGEYFIEVLSRRYGISPAPTLSAEALAQARAHAWPGNVREWRNVLARAVLSSQNPIRTLDFDLDGRKGALREVSQVSTAPLAAERAAPTSSASTVIATDGPLLDFESLQRAYFTAVLARTHGKISGAGGAAEICGLHPNTLRSRLERLGLL